ncbi:hypothetical protein ACL9RL_01875 [Plantibacter sp. Mn2098]|uniref:hypothetical protein n=1 Tax=Plantibacter sp. Mn2098 TaxID=3395266 RepID=UPI003BBA0B38
MSISIRSQRRRAASSPITRGSRYAALLAVPMLAFSLAACSAGAGGAGSSPTSTESAEQELQSWNLKFAACMRDAGIDYPDAPLEQPGITDEAAFGAASTACLKTVGEPPASSRNTQTLQEFDEEQLHLAICLRGRGFDVADPERSGVGVYTPEGATQADFDACSS